MIRIKKLPSLHQPAIQALFVIAGLVLSYSALTMLSMFNAAVLAILGFFGLTILFRSWSTGRLQVLVTPETRGLVLERLQWLFLMGTLAMIFSSKPVAIFHEILFLALILILSGFFVAGCDRYDRKQTEASAS